MIRNKNDINNENKSKIEEELTQRFQQLSEKINEIKQFIIEDSQTKVELKIFEDEFNFEFDFDEKIVAIYKYNLILSKLKTFSQIILLNFNKNEEIFKKTLDMYLELRNEIFVFSHHFFKKTYYYEQIQKIIKFSKKEKILLLRNFKLITIFSYIVNLVNIITQIIKNNLVEKVQRKQLNHFISKIIFYLSFVILLKL